jgi:hypothetical protein
MKKKLFIQWWLFGTDTAYSAALMVTFTTFANHPLCPSENPGIVRGFLLAKGVANAIALAYIIPWVSIAPWPWPGVL